MEERPPESREAPARPSDEAGAAPGERFAEVRAGSGWVTTKQAAKALDVSRRSVQSYVRRGLLRAMEEGDGPNKRFLVSIDSLNAMIGRRRNEADQAANLAEPSLGPIEAANAAANVDEGLRHLVDRLEARTAEATELRLRLELTERAESTLREELEEAHRRREQAERERDGLAARLAALEEGRGSREAPAEEAGGVEEDRPTTAAPQEPARRRSALYRFFFGE